MALDMAKYRALFLEEGTEHLAEISRAINIPVATGEHEYTKYGFRELIVAGGADIVQPDVGRVGGVTEWMKVAHMAHGFNLPVAPHAVQLVHLHVACATPNLKVVEYMNTALEADRIWYKEFPEQKDGMWSPFPDKPGLGLELDPEAVERYAVRPTPTPEVVPPPAPVERPVEPFGPPSRSTEAPPAPFGPPSPPIEPPPAPPEATEPG